MSMISELVKELREASDWHYHNTDQDLGMLLDKSADTIEMLSEKARESKQGGLTDLYISDCGHIRRVGDNCHDMLTINKDGKLRYYNLQNGDGCKLGEAGEWYNFVPNVDDYGYNCDPRKDEPQAESQTETKNSNSAFEKTDCQWK